MSQPQPRPTPEDLQRAVAQLEDLVNGTGEHEGHTRTQVGRCVYCSCGSRYQGVLKR